ncbi:hypothetical protein [Amycolatopsis sp. NPDC004079]|uniref:hypothetical protein n=1 Tax=Amycolatopsis sp. NPDC004079 TaxID=3154549 RepID=UPI0033B9B0D3
MKDATILTNFTASPELAGLLGATGLALVRPRMSDVVGYSTTCRGSLAGAPPVVSVRSFPDGRLYVRAHHADWSVPAEDNSASYIVSGLGINGMPMLLVRSSAEVVGSWVLLRARGSGGSGIVW